MNDQIPSYPAEHFKWFVLDEAGAAKELGAIFAYAPSFFPGANVGEVDEIVASAVLELYDAGLIALFQGSRDEAYQIETDKLDQVEQLSRDEIVRALENVDSEPLDAMTFFLETEKGAEVFQGLPPGVVPKLSGGWTNPLYADSDERDSDFH